MRDLGIAGCVLQAFGPAAAFILLKLRLYPQLTLIAVSGSFLFVLSMLLCSSWWHIIPSMRTDRAWNAFWGVIFQTAIRIGFFFVYLRTEKGFTTQGEAIFASNFGGLPVAAATGFGFGLAEVLLTFGMLLNNSFNISGPGATIYDVDRCPGLPFLYLQSLHGCFFIILHAMWLIILFAGMTSVTDPSSQPLGYATVDTVIGVRHFPGNTVARNTGWALIAAAVVLHLVASLSTVAPCNASLPLVTINVIVSTLLALYCGRMSHSPFVPIPKPVANLPSAPAVSGPVATEETPPTES